MKFNTKYERDAYPKESNSGESRVEKAGYVPPKVQIEAMINAGMRLDQSRKEAFDFPDGEIDESFNDPTREPNFDMADASQMQMDIEGKLKEEKKTSKSKVSPELEQESTGNSESKTNES